MFIKELKDFLAELEETRVGGRKIAHVSIDVREGKVDVEFDQIESDGESLLAVYEANSLSVRERCKNDLDKWSSKLKLKDMLTREKYQHRVILELTELLNSGFLIPEMDLLTHEQREEAKGEMERMGLDVKLGDKYALLAEMTTMKGGVYQFKSDRLLDSYLEMNKESLNQKSIEAMLRFRYAMEIIAREMPEDKAVIAGGDAEKSIPQDCLTAVTKVVTQSIIIDGGVVLRSQEQIRKAAAMIDLARNVEVAMLMSIGIEVGTVKANASCPDFVRALIGMGIIAFTDNDAIGRMADGMSKKKNGYSRGDKTYPPLPANHLRWSVEDQPIGRKLYNAMMS